MSADFSMIKQSTQLQSQTASQNAQIDSLGKSKKSLDTAYQLNFRDNINGIVKSIADISKTVLNIKLDNDKNDASNQMKVWQTQEDAIIKQSIDNGETTIDEQGNIVYGKSVTDFRESVRKSIDDSKWLSVVKQDAKKSIETSFQLSDIQSPLTMADKLNKDATNRVSSELDGIKTASSYQPYQSHDYSAYDAKLDSLKSYGFTDSQIETAKISGHREIDYDRLENEMVSYGKSGDGQSVDTLLGVAQKENTITAKQAEALKAISTSASSAQESQAKDDATSFVSDWTQTDKPIATMRASAKATAATIINPKARKAYEDQVESKHLSYAKDQVSGKLLKLDGADADTLKEAYDSFTTPDGSNTDILSGLNDTDKALALSSLKSQYEKQLDFENTQREKYGKQISATQLKEANRLVTELYSQWDNGKFTGEQYTSAIKNAVSSTAVDKDGNQLISGDDLIAVLKLQNEYTDKILGDKVPAIYKGDYKRVTDLIDSTLLGKFNAKSYDKLSEEDRKEFNTLITWADSDILDVFYQGRDGSISTQILNDECDKVIGVLNGNLLEIAGKSGIGADGTPTGGLKASVDPFDFFNDNNEQISTIVGLNGKGSNSEAGNYNFPNEETKSTVAQAYYMAGDDINKSQITDGGKPIEIKCKEGSDPPQFENVNGNVLLKYHATNDKTYFVDPASKQLFSKDNNGNLIPVGNVKSHERLYAPVNAQRIIKKNYPSTWRLMNQDKEEQMPEGLSTVEKYNWYYEHSKKK